MRLDRTASLSRHPRLRAARAIHDKAVELDLELPIISEVYRVLYDGKHPRDAVRDLEKRPQGYE